MLCFIIIIIIIIIIVIIIVLLLLLLLLLSLLLLLLLLLSYVRIKGKYRASKCGLTENRQKSAKYQFALTFLTMFWL